MTKIGYTRRRFRPDGLRVIAQAEEICEDYAEQGYDLTLRQLYYQFVARGLIPNSQRSYNRLGEIISGARMAGMLSWDYIVDRTRNLRGPSHWESPADILLGAAQGYARDKWAGQANRVEVWVEKEALAGVVQRAATTVDVNHFSCRGYVSQSEMWRAGRRIGRMLSEEGVERVVILHLGDHDPSGIDMTRDIKDRLGHFIGVDHARELVDGLNPDAPEVKAQMEAKLQRYMDRLEVRRIALNMDQIEAHDPPPNPAKMSDARAGGYVSRFGAQSWELDALPPDVLDELIRSEVYAEMDAEAFDEQRRREEDEKRRLRKLAREWRQA